MGSEESAVGGMFALRSHLHAVQTSFSPSIIHFLITPEMRRGGEQGKKQTLLQVQYCASHVFPPVTQGGGALVPASSQVAYIHDVRFRSSSIVSNQI